MPYRDISVWLEDIMMAAERVLLYTKDIQSFSGYANNFLIRDATERNLEIIAEALKNALKLEPGLPITDKKKIIGLRNIINHQYYEVDMTEFGSLLQKTYPFFRVK